ncbi:InlB B-repeat-containing protein [Paenibacillus methanolicus]|uniref:Putative repeat protein (TIGR02543 family) n=1 Tax=Paenibacillus methanolicus TaxID=582686 RepID=A0A5S5BY30_9BACL|nr:InlB B-repeat-containing protein [Paenibacillus methanolicus]TYP71859.1 putative repeat protein (TIGR02543 family) [Paenibacillus methanolicus]
MRERVSRRLMHIMLALLIGTVTVLGGASPSRTAHAAAGQPLLGEIKLFPYGIAPTGWIYLEGQELDMRSNTALFALLGDRFGGDGKLTFRVPNLKGKEPLPGTGYYMATVGSFPSREGGGNPNASMLGEIRILPYVFAPDHTRRADNAILESAEYPALYGLLGNRFGGSDQFGTFALPGLDPLAEGVNYYVTTIGSMPTPEGTGNEFYGELLLFPYDLPAVAGSGRIVRADGSDMAIGQNQALFSLLGIKFGGDGRTTFKLPNLSGVNRPELQVHIVQKGWEFPRYEQADNPVAADDRYGIEPNSALTIPAPGVLANDQRALTAKLMDSPSHGTLTFSPDGSFEYKPHSNYVGRDFFTYVASNESGSSGNLGSVYITVEPKTVIGGVENDARYNRDVTITFTGGLATLNGSAIASGVQVGEERDYELIVTSAVSGTATTIRFAIDKTPPVVTGVEAGREYETPPTVTFNEGTATLDGRLIPSETVVDGEGPHTLIVTDSTGNVTTIDFSVHLARTVTFESNGGSAVGSRTVAYNASVTAPVAPTREGHMFGGWYADSGLTTSYDFAAPVKSDITLYAKWTVNTHAVTFESNGGSAVASRTVAYNASVTAPVAPTREGHTFGGWYADSGLTTAYDFAASVKSDITLYAKWTVNTHAVTFESNGGSAVASRTVAYNASVTAPVAPTREGHTFGGWYADSGLTTAYDFDAPVKSDITLYAKWTAIPTPSIPSTPGATPPSNPSEPNPSTAGQTKVTVGGLDAGAVMTKGTTADGRKMMSVSFDPVKLAKALAAIAGTAKPIAIEGSEDVVQVELPSRVLTDLAGIAPETRIDVIVDGASYLLPVGLIGAGGLPETVTLTIGKASEAANRELEASAAKQGAKLLVERPIEFELEIDGRTVNEFGGVYVERTIVLRGETKGAVGVWLAADGTLRFAPSFVSERGGVPVLVIRAPHNSVYAAISSSSAFGDMRGHWAQQEADLLAGSFILQGTSAAKFAPDQAVTRAEFAAMLTRALGLAETASREAFTDVAAGAWYADAVEAARLAGLVAGGPDGAFHPSANITREEMAMMLLRAYRFAGGKAVAAEPNALERFRDREEISPWAAESAGQAVSLGLIGGTPDGAFEADESADRAQAAVMLTRLLQALGYLEA